jgi:hypothetical protein
MSNLQTMRILLSFAFILLFIRSEAQIGGRGVYNFLDVVSSPRLAGLGSKAVAFDENDLNFALANPSMLRPSMHNQIAISNLNFPVGIGSAEASYVYHKKGWATFQAGMKYLNYGQFDAANFQGIITGSFTAADYAFLLSASRQIDTNWNIGIQFKIINSVLESYTSWGLAADVAASYRIPEKNITFSLLLRNMGTQLTTYSGVKEPLPFEIQFGVSNKFEHMPFRWHVTLEHLQRWDLSYFNPNLSQVDPLTGEFLDQEVSFGQMFMRHVLIGAEFQMVPGFHFHTAYSFRRRAEMSMLTRRSSAGLSFGFGIRIFKTFFNYSRSIHHVAGATNQVGLTIDIDKYKKK